MATQLAHDYGKFEDLIDDRENLILNYYPLVRTIACRMARRLPPVKPWPVARRLSALSSVTRHPWPVTRGLSPISRRRSPATRARQPRHDQD